MAMKTYNFDEVVSRRHSDSVKWNRYPVDVLPLWVADMDFPSPPEVVEAMNQRASHPFFGYAGRDNTLIDAICNWVHNRHGWKIEPDWVLLMSGVVTGMNWVAQSFLKPEDSLIFHTPVYPPFFSISENAGIGRLELPMVLRKNNYVVDFDQFKKAINSSVKLYVLCNPQNPVGRVFSRSELERINQICIDHGLLICSDEIHCDLTLSNHPHIPLASLSNEAAQNTVTLMAPSKTFNIPGLHFSFAVVPNSTLREKMETNRRGVVGYPGLLANAAAKAAFINNAEWLDQLLNYLRSNRDFLVDFVSAQLPGIKMIPPEGTYLAWLDCSDLNLQPDPYNFFLKYAKVALNDGAAFGDNGKNFVRLNFGCPRAILVEALQRMSIALRHGSAV